MNSHDPTRRAWLGAGLGLGLLAALPRRAGAATLCDTTPRQTEGPFYPVYHRLDEDNDLTVVQGKSGAASGQVIRVCGWVADESTCRGLPGALVEIWQACASGSYDHPADDNPAPRDPNFQYWGRAVSDEEGFYTFKTIKPGAYPADNSWVRPPHIHFKAHRRGYLELTTQMYFDGERYNATDRVLQRLTPDEQKRVVVAPDKGDDGLPVFAFNLRLAPA
jgi:protocatechuate 3,4-dioxygenase beta subunit